MDITVVKGVDNIGRRRMRTVDGATAAKCVKRRRRDTPSMVPVSITSGDVDQNQLQADGVAPASIATTVKRSSRFRGVSRSIIDTVNK